MRAVSGINDDIVQRPLDKGNITRCRPDPLTFYMAFVNWKLLLKSLSPVWLWTKNPIK